MVRRSPWSSRAAARIDPMATEACCFPNDDCLDLPYDDCLERGGLPIGVDTSCGPWSGPYGWRCEWQACCYVVSMQDVCDDMTPADCRSFHGSPMGRGSTCRAVDSAGGCGLAGIPYDCCLPDGSRLDLIMPEYCEAFRGVAVFPDQECPPPAGDEDCREPGPDQTAGPIWSLELCAAVPFTPAVAPDDQPTYRPGYAMLVTPRGVRNTLERECDRQGATTLYLDARNYADPVFCSEQRRFPGGRAHAGVAVLQPAEDSERVTRPGYGVFVSAYDAPDWTEAVLGSIRLRCWGPEL